MRSFCLTVILVGVLSPITASAEELSEYFHCFREGCKEAYYRNKCWPEPYVHYDRAAVIAPFAIMKDKGWQQQNMIGAHHYKPDTLVLNEAGLLRVRWILTQAPMNRRTVYVEPGHTVDQTSDRLQAVQSAASRFVLASETADVQLSEMTTHGWSGDYIQTMNARYKASQPAPRLPPPSGGVNVE